MLKLNILSSNLSRFKNKYLEDNFNYKRQVFWSFFIKFFSTLFGFYIVTISLVFLGQQMYGVWMAMYTFVSWFAFLDLGIGGGLRNKFGETFSKNNITKSREIISTAYFSLFAISFFSLFIFILVSQYINWYSIFNLIEGEIENLNMVMNIIFITFITLITGKLSGALLNAVHKSHLIALGYLIFQILIVLGIEVLLNFGIKINNKLFIFAIVTLLATIISYYGFSIYTFIKYFKNYLPKSRNFNSAWLREIFHLSLKFFIIQICVMLLYSTDVFLINYFVGSNEVAVYSIFQKYYGISLIVFGLIIGPAWSAIVSAKSNNNFKYLISLKRKLILFVYLVVILNVILFFIQPFIFSIWVNDLENVNVSTSILMSIFISISCLMQVFSSFHNGFGTIKIQMLYAIFASIFNLIFTIIGLKYFHFGINWAILISIAVNIPGAILYNIQVNKLIKNQASSIWAK